MAEHDRLPPELRRFVIHADLPWSARSVLSIWRKARRRGHCPAQALALLDRAARATLARDAAQVWGPDHPAAGNRLNASQTPAFPVWPPPSAT